jgi:choline kinase
MLERLVEMLTHYVDLHSIYVVVGFKKEMIMESMPELIYVYNERFHVTNTSKSLLAGLRKAKGDDVIWVNGDVVLEPLVVRRIAEFAGPCMAVNRARVGDEEVKYLLSENGTISRVAKTIQDAPGEALGINKLDAESIETIIDHLETCADSDYFERAIELAIEDGFKIYPVDVSDLLCVEVDDHDDLDRANDLVKAAELH